MICQNEDSDKFDAYNLTAGLYLKPSFDKLSSVALLFLSYVND
jgi:hypothetical protein